MIVIKRNGQTEEVSFDKVIPLADGARKVYKDEGLVYYEEEDKCVV